VYFSVLQCVAVCCSVHITEEELFSCFRTYVSPRVLQCIAVYCSVLQCVAVCVAVCCSVHITEEPSSCFRTEVSLECCSVLQCIEVCCSVLQCVAVCCSVLQCVAEYI